MSHCVWFEIPVTDLERAKAFYEHVLQEDMSLQQMDEFKMAFFKMEEGKYGSTGTLCLAESYVPSHQGTMVYLGVTDIDGTLKRVEENGGSVLNPKMSIGEHGFVAHFEDSEGNRVGLHSDKG